MKERMKLPLRAGLLTLLLAVLLALTAAVCAEARWPEAPGSLKKDGKLQLDANHVSEGYFTASLQSANSHRMKLRVTKGDTTLTYDINSEGEFEVFPLQLGDGSYTVTLYENVSGKKYASAGKLSLNVTLSEKDVCFLYPNQYVNYTPETEVVNIAEELCAGVSGMDIFKKIASYVTGGNYTYDFVKALTVKAGVLPDIEECYKKKMGICQDLSALMCCMLRTQGVPARLTIGFADKNYHAWVEFRYEGDDHFYDPTLELNGIGKVKTYSVERFY